MHLRHELRPVLARWRAEQADHWPEPAGSCGAVKRSATEKTSKTPPLRRALYLLEDSLEKPESEAVFNPAHEEMVCLELSEEGFGFPFRCKANHLYLVKKYNKSIMTCVEGFIARNVVADHSPGRLSLAAAEARRQESQSRAGLARVLLRAARGPALPIRLQRPRHLPLCLAPGVPRDGRPLWPSDRPTATRAVRARSSTSASNPESSAPGSNRWLWADRSPRRQTTPFDSANSLRPKSKSPESNRPSSREKPVKIRYLKTSDSNQPHSSSECKQKRILNLKDLQLNSKNYTRKRVDSNSQRLVQREVDQPQRDEQHRERDAGAAVFNRLSKSRSCEQSQRDLQTQPPLSLDPGTASQKLLPVAASQRLAIQIPERNLDWARSWSWSARSLRNT